MRTSISQPLNAATMQDSPLAQLKDIHLPAAVHWWPPAYGWWILGILLILAFSAASYALFTLWKNRQYQRLALKQLQEIESHHLDDQNFTLAMAQLLRQCAISAAIPQAAIAQGEQWQSILKLSMKQEYAHFLAIGRYQRSVIHLDQTALIMSVKQWIKKSHTFKKQLLKGVG